MDFYQILASVAGIMGVGVSVPQAIRIYQTKHSKDVSLTMFSILGVVQVLWMIYGVHLKDLPISLSNFLAFLVTVANIFLILRYRNGKNAS
jgi:MtN3 and saliva related transmembrane protein